MAVPTSGAVAFSTVHSEFAPYGWANNVGSSYYGKTYFTAAGAATFPSSSFPMSRFYGTSPDDEWNCNCNCQCGK